MNHSKADLPPENLRRLLLDTLLAKDCHIANDATLFETVSGKFPGISRGDIVTQVEWLGQVAGIFRVHRYLHLRIASFTDRGLLVAQHELAWSGVADTSH